MIRLTQVLTRLHAATTVTLNVPEIARWWKMRDLYLGNSGQLKLSSQQCVLVD